MRFSSILIFIQAIISNCFFKCGNVLYDVFISDDDPRVCCSVFQLEAFHVRMEMAESVGFSRCQSCMQNFRRIICHLSCSPYQSNYIKVIRTNPNINRSSSQDVIAELNYYVSRQ